MLESCESFVLEQYKYIYAHKIYYLVDLNKGSKLPESYFFLAILNGSEHFGACSSASRPRNYLEQCYVSLP